AEDGIRDYKVTGVQTCALPIYPSPMDASESRREAGMRDWIDIKGASGAVYRFHLFKDGRPLSPMGGNYIYARKTGDRFEALYVRSEERRVGKEGRSRGSR